MHSLRTLMVSVIAVVVALSSIEAEEPERHRGSDTGIESLLLKESGVKVDLPEVGYSWTSEAVAGDAASGSLEASSRKVIYYFVHWGPVETEEINEAYARQRIPELWPSEGLEVTKVETSVVAGHPAVYAEAVPARQFYRAFFLIWNCPETGRQFIADMNYNVAVGTPRSELDAEIETTRKTLACHPGAPVEALPGHIVRYDNPRYGLSLSHPAHWYVFDSPYGVAHPAYRGIRDRTIGSILGWLQDMEVSIRFQWQPIAEPAGESGTAMDVNVDLYAKAVETALASDEVADFVADSYEMLRFGATPVLKVVGTATKTPPEERGLDRSPKERLMVLAAVDKESGRLFFTTIRIDYHLKDGLYDPPDRAILDRWAASIVQGLEL